jgi:hypothetical protein
MDVEDDNFKEINSINLSFPDLHEDIGVDVYRVYYLQKCNENIVAFGAYFTSQDDVDNNIGSTMMFWLGRDLDLQNVTMGKLDAKAFFWSDMNHQDDETIPMVKIDFIEGEEKDQYIYFAQ